MDLEGAGGLAIHTIISKLSAKDTAAVACASKRLNIWASDDSHWSRFCAHELHLSSPQDPLGSPLKSFKEAYEKWHEAFHMYPWSLVKRVKRCWDRLKSWLAVNFPEALGTLRKGASEEEINELEKCLNVKLPLPTKLLYRFCDGQEVPSEGQFKDRMLATSLGLIGGYWFYEHMVNVFLLPLKQVVGETNFIRCRLEFRRKSEFVVVASSYTSGEKIFFLNCADRQLYVGTRDLTVHKEMLPCVPDPLLRSVHVSNGSNEQQDGLLLWLEEHGRRLETGFIKIREEKKIKSICQFPEQAPLCSTAVTNGVQVRASACFVPEFSTFKNEPEMYFSYSIRMSLVPEGCVVNGLKFESCQLYWRRWLIRGNDKVESDVNGEAVIGKFPFLRPGEKEFVYQSCTPLSVSTGSVEGSFTFVPGRLTDPKGSPFEVEVASFPLCLPDYIF